MKILVIGASGHVGSLIAPLLAAHYSHELTFLTFAPLPTSHRRAHTFSQGIVGWECACLGGCPR
jgi:uncharacterized protein YbjT (DUF2867 family)